MLNPHRPGDNAYNTGTDAVYQYNFFSVYGNTSAGARPPLLARMATYPVLGNHEVYSWLYQAAENGGYRTAFGDALLSAGQGAALSGGPGVPSGTWRYYSANYGRTHIVAVDSMTTRSNTSSAWRVEHTLPSCRA